MRRTLAACVVALLMLAGCSGGDDKADSTSTTAGGAAAGPTTTVRPVNTSFSGANSAQFCALARTYNDRFTSVGANPTPAQLRTVAREGQTAISQAVGAAPAEIKPDVEVLARVFGALLTELEGVNFDVMKLPPAAFTGLSSQEFTAATQRFQAYNKSVCGIN